MVEKQKQHMHKFGLLGKDIAYSFSRSHFKEKFANENITNCSYENFDLDSISEFPSLIKANPNIKGINVTIPYKEAVMPYLDKINKKATAIGAVNTIKITKKGKLVGYNTDYYGFKKSIKPYLKPHHNKALILGTGGASKAVAYALKSLDVSVDYVSRNISSKAKYSYDTLSKKIVSAHSIIINCTPLGTHPNISEHPDIPFEGITENHILYDLIYNPKETVFLKKGKERGASICNGLFMLHLQAEKSWKIWNT